MLRSEAGRLALVGLCASVLLSACSGDGGREREDADVGGGDGATGQDAALGSDEDASGDGGSGSDAATSRMDGGGAADAGSAAEGGSKVDGGSAADAGTDASGSVASDASTDASLGVEEPLDGGALGPLQFAGPPFAAPKLPVQRLALDSSGTRAVCVVLEDRTLYCVRNHTDPEQRKSFTDYVPDNRDFVQVVMVGGDGNFFFGLRSDGSIAAFRSGSAGGAWGQAGEQYIGAFGNGSTPCVLRTSGEVSCTNGAALPRYPAGPYVQFAGRITDPVGHYAGLRADGVLIAGPTADGGALAFRDEIFVGMDMEQAPSFCAVAKSGSVYCAKGSGSLLSLVRQPYSNVRDVSRALNHVCAVLQDGKASCSFDGAGSSSKVPAEQRFVDIETINQTSTCGVNESGELWCWGDSASSLVQVPLPKKAALQ